MNNCNLTYSYLVKNIFNSYLILKRAVLTGHIVVRRWQVGRLHLEVNSEWAQRLAWLGTAGRQNTWVTPLGRLTQDCRLGHVVLSASGCHGDAAQVLLGRARREGVVSWWPTVVNIAHHTADSTCPLYSSQTPYQWSWEVRQLLINCRKHR